MATGGIYYRHVITTATMIGVLALNVIRRKIGYLIGEFIC